MKRNLKNTVWRALLVSLLLAAMLLSVVACGGAGTDATDTTETTPATEGVATQPSDTSAETSKNQETQQDTERETSDESEVATDGVTETEAEAGTEEETEAETESLTFEVTEKDGVAQVLTSAGLSYALTGYDSLQKVAATFSDALTVTFAEGIAAETFNRFSMEYTATSPLKVYVTYKQGGKTCEDDYFVEEGRGVFSGLVKGFLDSAKGDGVLSLRVVSCKEGSAVFALRHMTTEVMAVPDKTVYIQNDAFKLGVDLAWGGTLNYLRDKTARVQGVTNLVNKHDTGRLIQQSFYGTAGVPGVYQPGMYGEAQWVYNPVQGGDLYGNASRLVDLVITETSVYIKSQPQDWAMNNQLTPSYMENTYSLEGEMVRVNNRFVDFSGWEHPYTSQELPALYTISYLDTFVWYDGENGWKGEALSERADLPFWGDSAYGNTCSFPLKENNTETWCAWVNTDIDYGLGLYVPNVDSYKAGRYAYDGTKDADGDACNYVAPLNTLKLVSYEALEYSYLLTTGTVQEIRDAFTGNKDFATNESLHKNYLSTRIPAAKGDITALDFTTDDNIKMLTVPNQTTVAFDADEDAVKLTALAGSDPHVTIPYYTAEPALDASVYTLLRIEYMLPTTNSKTAYQCDLFLCVGDTQTPAEKVRVRANLICDGEYQALEIDMSKLSFWSGEISQIRFDYFDSCAAGDVMYITSISLS